MTHWIIAPVILPALLAPLIVLAARYHIGIQRVFSMAGVMMMIVIIIMYHYIHARRDASSDSISIVGGLGAVGICVYVVKQRAMIVSRHDVND